MIKVYATIAVIALATSYYLGVRLTESKWQKKADDLQLETVRQKLEIEKKHREQEQSWASKLHKAEVDNEELQNTILHNAVIADNSAMELHDKVASYSKRLQRCTKSAAATDSRPSQGVDMLTELFRAADETAGDMARIADERGIALKLCEQSYNAISK